MADRETRVKLGYTVDSQSVTAAVNANAKVAASYESVSAAAAKFSPEVLRLNPALAALAAQEQSVAAATQRLAQTQTLAANATVQNTSALAQQRAPLQDLTALYASLEQQELKAAAAGATVSPPRSGGGNNGTPIGFGTFRSLGSAFSNLGGGSGVTQLASLAGLGAELGVIGVAAGATAVVLKALNAEQERQTKVYEARLDIERSAAREIADLTTQQVQQRIRAAEQQLEIDKEVSRQQAANALLYNLSFVDQPLKLGAALAGLDPLYNAYQNALAKNQVALEGDQAQIDAFTKALDGNAAKVNSLTQAQLASADRALRIDGMTREAREKQIAQNERDIATLTALAERGDNTGDTFKSLLAQIDALQLETEGLKAVTSSFADELEREAEARRAQLAVVTDAIAAQADLTARIRESTVEQVADRLNAIEDERSALLRFLPDLERLAPTSSEAAKALADARARLGELSADFYQTITRVLPEAQKRAIAELQADQADLRAQSQLKLNEIEANRLEADAKALDARNDAYLSAEEKRAEALIKLAEDQAAARARIERKSGVDIANAVYRRDALAAFLALQAKQEQLQDLKAQGEERAAELDQQSAKERQQADRNFDKALRNAQDAANKSARLERDRATRELNERINAYNAQIALLDTFNVQGTQQIAQFVNNALNALRNLATGVGSLLSGASGGSGGVGGAVGGVISTPGIPAGLPPGWVPFPPITGTAARGVGGAVGGLLLANRPPYATSGGAIGSNDVSGAMPARGTLPNRIQRAASVYDTPRLLAGGGSAKGGLTINLGGVHGTELRKRDIIRMFDQQLDEHLTEAGYD